MEIETSARLHLSLIDLNGLEGRIDGGIGVTLNDPSLKMECFENTTETKIYFDDKINQYQKDYAEKIYEAYDKMIKYLNIEKNYTFNIKDIYPIHHGLGLGTQLLLSVGKLISQLNNVELNVYELAKIVNRGGTSGIGVQSFQSGGFIIDGGHKKDLKNNFLPSSASKVSPPPVIARYDFPEDWNIILAIPNDTKSVSGQREIDIFQKYTPINIRDVEKISYLTLMKLMPAVLEKDINNFGDAINKIQNLGFKKIERKLQSELITETIDFMSKSNVQAVGMSSFGPTCFGITDENVTSLKKELKQFLGKESTVIVTNGKNVGSSINEV